MHARALRGWRINRNIYEVLPPIFLSLFRDSGLCRCTLMRQWEKETERDRTRERNSMHWIRRSVGCRVASASPRLATRHSSPDVTAARFIASVNLRRLTSRQVSGYLPTYLPIYPPIYLSIYLSVTSHQHAGARRNTLCSPLLSSALFPRERVTRDSDQDGQISGHYALLHNGVFWLFLLFCTDLFTNLKFFSLESFVFL